MTSKVKQKLILIILALVVVIGIISVFFITRNDATNRTNTTQNTTDTSTTDTASADTPTTDTTSAINTSITTNTTIESLKTNYQTNPLGIDITTAPIFSWNMSSNIISQSQSKYQLIVYKDSLDGKVAWDSGIVTSDKSTGIIYSGDDLELETRYYWTVTVYDNNDNEFTSSTAYFESGCSWDSAQWITAQSENGAPMFRTESSLNSESSIQSARLYITALGIYQAYINGNPVEIVKDDSSKITSVFGPGFTDYNTLINYQSYDITSYINDNSLAIGVLLGAGWYAGEIGNGSNFDQVLSSDNKELSFIAKLVINYSDGTQEVVNTDSTSWKSSDLSNITMNDFYNGENYDATIDTTGWNNVNYDDSSWTNQITVPEFNHSPELIASSSTLAYIDKTLDQKPIDAFTYDPNAYLKGEKDGSTDSSYYWGEEVTTPVSTTGEIELQPDQTLIIDLGQNFAGVENFTVKGKQGTKVTVRTAEVLNDGQQNTNVESGGSDGSKDSIYITNYRSALSTDTYIIGSTDVAETYQPTFTFHGFRYLEFTTTDPITLSNVVGKVITSVLSQTGTITTNNSDANQLFTNNLWSQRSNYLSILTDCPQRNERQGWTGDAQLYSQTALYNFDSYPILDGYVNTMNHFSESSEGGTVYGVVMPIGFMAAMASWESAGWSDAGIIIPWTMYQQNGDISILEKSYPQMDAYMKQIGSLSSVENNYNQMMFGDWLAYQGTSILYMNKIYRAYDALIMSKAATALDKAEDAKTYRNLFDLLKEDFIQTYYDEDNNLLTASADNVSSGNELSNAENVDNSQTGILWALKLGLYKDNEQKQVLLNCLVTNIANENQSIRPDFEENSLSVGFLGVNVLLPTLSDEGKNATAYNLLLNTGDPSWLGEVKNGATTIWERWNSYSSDNSFGDASMNSFNHYSYGACAQWMYQYMAGIQSSEAIPGFKEIILQPTLDTGTKYNTEDRITSVDGSYDSLYGKIKSSWTSNKNGQLHTYNCTIPANTTAILYLPVNSADNFTDIKGVTYKGIETHNGIECAKFILQSGSFVFTLSDNQLTVTIADGYVDISNTQE